MSQHKAAHAKYYDLEKNAELALKVFHCYYRDHNHSGRLYSDFPDFFMVKPDVLIGKDIASRASEKILLDDAIQRAKSRNGFIGVSKHRNPKLGYYWLELSVLPFMLGDPVTKDNKGEFFYLLTKFIEYTKLHPKVYGDLTAEIDSDKDLALMFDGIHKMGERLTESTHFYPRNMMVSYNPNWPPSEVKNLLESLKDNDQDWCQVFFEYMMYVMSNKSK